MKTARRFLDLVCKTDCCGNTSDPDVRNPLDLNRGICHLANWLPNIDAEASSTVAAVSSMDHKVVVDRLSQYR